ncbi:gliding motility-associated C-terminal domain-containing protein [Bizionia argentinensis JUB59]|uniref:Gliding motility-associated C-terminal domain-containing protein n=1 Tax=Bizionia argentinensis JUB59 TaxID=1046627 RepID=G2EA06_9FLAO|nr:gliding motility-associated C-terminal domain-containing protein [Bizionia argentinensis]EGV44655.1 gliding motility-associated C-terminal domain-containing protein [Bizionia argentinensis JUB59]
MQNISLFISLVLLFAFSFMKAQTTNEGMLFVGEDTQFSTVERFDNLTTGSFYNDGDTYIYSHFNNDGTLDFYQNTGLTRFIGTSFQAISGSGISYLYDVYFNNSSNVVPFQLSGNLNVSGESDFYEGIVDNDNFGGKMTFNTNAFHINTSDYSHVDGAVNKLGNQEFTYPIGDGGYYRFASISVLGNSAPGNSAPGNSAALFEGKFYFENSNNLYSHELKAGVIEEIDNQEYWTIEKVSANTDDGLITLSWRDVTTPAIFIQAAEQDALTIVRWDVATNIWVDEGGAIDLDSQTVTTSVSGYGVFTFGRVKSDLILPCGVVVYNSVTPNNDGKNDFFFIDTSAGDCARNLKVKIFNRWGVKVFETNNYGVNGHIFDGYSTGRLTTKDSELLPSGTYYYILEYDYGNEADNNRHKQAGFLYLSAN